MSHTTIPSDWYTEFFTELTNEFWRRMATPEMTKADIDFLVGHLTLNPGSRILDAPCGSGRHSLALAALGHAVTGVDISTEAIEHASATAAATGQRIDFRVADIRDLPQTGDFDAAVCLGNSFGYLDIAGTRAFVAALAAAVRPGGGLVVDFMTTAETVLPGYTGAPRTFVAGDITVDATTEYDVENSRLLSGYRYTRGTEQWQSTALHHIYTSAQIGQLLTDAGFTGIERFAGPDGAPYRLGSGRLLVTARRG